MAANVGCGDCDARCGSLLPHITEKAFLAQVVELARLCGWEHFHVFDSRKSDRGWPDLVLWRPPRSPELIGIGKIIFAELKQEGKSTTAIQDRTIRQLRSCGCEVHVWVPSMFDELAEVLR